MPQLCYRRFLTINVGSLMDSCHKEIQGEARFLEDLRFFKIFSVSVTRNLAAFFKTDINNMK